MDITKVKGILLAIFLTILFVPVFLPQIDLAISSLFYLPEKGFPLANDSIFTWIHWLTPIVAWVVGGTLIGGLAVTALCRKPACGMYMKKISFLILVLVIGAGLIVNLGFKDNWGRDRPREIVQFGGTEKFTPALVPQFEKASKNGSFVCGDGAFGFFMPAFGYVAPLSFSRYVFWLGMGVGVIFSSARLVVGAHFFSDIVGAAFLMLTVAAGIHMLMFGKEETRARLRLFFAIGNKSTNESKNKAESV